MTGLPCRVILEGELSERVELVSAGLPLRSCPGYIELSGTLTDQAALLSLLLDGGLQILTIRIGRELRSDDPSTGELASAVATDLVNQLFSVGLTLAGLQALLGDGAAADQLAHAVAELDDAIRRIRTAALR